MESALYLPSVAAAAAAKSLQSCPALCSPIDSSPPGSPVPGILQVGTVEWVAISLAIFINGQSKKRVRKEYPSQRKHTQQGSGHIQRDVIERVSEQAALRV